MSQSLQGAITELVVSSGSTVSNSLSANYDYSDATQICIQSPGTMDAGTWIIQVSYNGSTWATLNDGSADIGPPAAGKARPYTEMLGFAYFRISGPTAAADRTFRVSKQWTV